MGSFWMKITEAGASFRLKDENGQIVGKSKIYKTETSCLNGVASMRRCYGGGIEDHTVPEPPRVKHPKYEIYQDEAGEYRFLLRARNGESILDSERSYPDKEACIAGIESVRRNVSGSELIRE